MGLFRKTLLGSALALAATAGSAYAVPITGAISITGYDNYTSSSVTFLGTGFANALGESGSFTVIGTTSNVTLTNFSYNPLSPSPVTIFSATNTAGTATAAFALSTVTSFDNSNNQLSINGIGSLSLTGYDTTIGSVYFSTQGGTGLNVSFSATAMPTAVPEPASMALLGAGLVGVGVFRRRRAK